MKVKLKDIKPSPRPVRSKWGEEAMEELKKSIAEHGLIVPIKVRPLDGKYEIVYGHRRVEAMRRLGWKECEAIVEGMELGDAHIQAFIENVQREDLSPMDKARALKAMQESTGWSLMEMERRGIMGHAAASEYTQLLREPQELTKDLERIVVAGRRISSELGVRHVKEISEAIPDEQVKIAVAEKVRREGLTTDQTKEVARTIAAEKHPEKRRALIETDSRSPAWRELAQVRAEARAEKKAEWWDKHPSTKEFLEMLRMYGRLMRSGWESASKEKIAPDHLHYLIGRIREFVAYLEEIIHELEVKAAKYQ